MEPDNWNKLQVAELAEEIVYGQDRNWAELLDWLKYAE